MTIPQQVHEPQTNPNGKYKMQATDPQAARWWEKSIVRRSTSNIEHLVDTMMESSSFLQRAQTLDDSIDTATSRQSASSSILSLNRANVKTGALLGKGSFSVVLEVKAIVEGREEDEEEESEDHTNTPLPSNVTYAQLLGQHRLVPRNTLTRTCRYAIKHLRPDLIQKNDADYFEDAAADLIMEAKYLGALNHPGILRLRGIAKGGTAAYEESGDYDSFFLITDRLDGTLKDRILEYQCMLQEESLLECFRGNQPQDETKDEHCFTAKDPVLLERQLLMEKLDMALQLSQALKYLHEQNLVFRDLKPQNVGLIGNQVKLFDFGFCREMPSAESRDPSTEGLAIDEDATYYMSGKGSLMYLAPEVLGSGKYNQKVDCYSFAMVLYELLTLSKPFHVAANIEVFRELICHHKARPPLEFSDIPEYLQDLLRHAWADTIHERWTMRQICDRLEVIVDNLKSSNAPKDVTVGIQAASNTQEEQVKKPAMGACNGGEVLGCFIDFCRDMRLGYKILTGHAKFATDSEQKCNAIKFQSKPIESSFTSLSSDSIVLGEPMVEQPQPQAQSEQHHYDLACSTEDTRESSVASSCSFGVIRRSHSAATEEPLEVLLQDTLFVARSQIEDNAAPVNEEEYRMDDNADAEDMEFRCPPSPPKRTISAPIEYNKISSSTEDSILIPEAYPTPMTRRSSCAGAFGTVPLHSNTMTSNVELRC